MNNNEKEKFLNDSFICEKVKLNPKIIFHRDILSPDDLASIKEDGKYSYSQRNKEKIELEIDGEVFANGKIVKSRGEYFFKITNLTGGNK